jgi:hypothetical protein
MLQQPRTNHQTDQATPTTPIVLTGGTTAFGTAIDNTGTDSFLLYGAGNTVVEGGGNLIVNGGNLAPFGWDTQSTILLGNAYAVNDTITLDGTQNVIAGGVLLASTVSIDVTGLTSSGVSKVGSNSVSLDNAQGSTSVRLTGQHNAVTLNGDATNTIVTGGAYATVNVGSLTDDDNFGWTTSIKLTGGSNTVTGGDENFTITGGAGHNVISLGDGNNTISLHGKANTISVWGGTNVITAGSTNATVTMLGTDGANLTAWANDQDDPFAGPPTDTVNIAGTADTVTATYENVIINGSGVTGNAKINLGNGNNSINVGGNFDAIAVGNGGNGIFLTGDNNTVTVTDTVGVGTDNVSVGNGTGDAISFDFAGGSVQGSTSGTVTVSQDGGASAVVNINLPNGTGIIFLGNGSDSITANGANSSIIAGDGNDTVNANGNGTGILLGNGDDTVNANGSNAIVIAGNGTDIVNANGTLAEVSLGYGNDVVNANGGGASVVAGDGNDTVYANGAGASVSLGNGNDYVSANGLGATVMAGNGNDTVSANGGSSSVTLGWGNDTVSATGPASSVLINAISTSQDSVTVGSSDAVRITSGIDAISGVAGDQVYLNGAQLNSTLLLTGNNNMAFIGSDSSVNIMLNQAQTGNAITVQADTGNTYGGVIDISQFNLHDSMTLNGLYGGVDGQLINSYAEVLKNITAGPVSDTLHLAGGGSIVFAAVTGFTSSEFHFGLTTGPV